MITQANEIAEKFNDPEYVDAPREEDPNGTILGSLLTDGTHLPIFDLDFDCRLVPSRTAGHFHLYINKPITKAGYRQILLAFESVGIVQQAWVNRLDSHDKTFLRLPIDPSMIPEFAPKSRYKDPELETKS